MSHHHHHHHHYHHLDDDATAKCIIKTLMCGGTMVAMTEYCDNVMVTYMEKYCDTGSIL